MTLSRRSLLSMLALAALDPERLLWTPGAKLISIPKPAPKHVFNIYRYSGPALLPRLIAVIHRHHDGHLRPTVEHRICGHADYDAIRGTIPHLRGPRSGHARMATNGITLWDTVPVGCPRFLPRIRSGSARLHWLPENGMS